MPFRPIGVNFLICCNFKLQQQVRVQTPQGLTAVNKMGSIRIQPPVATSQTTTLPPPLTSTSSPRPPVGGGRQMLVKAVPVKTPAGSHIKISTPLAPTPLQTNSITMPQPRIPPSPNIIAQPTTINKVPTPITVAPPIVALSKPPSKEKEKKSFSSSAAYV